MQVPNRPDPALIARWEPFRRAMRPAECTGAAPCWVIAPYDAMAPTKGAACRTCGGRLRRDWSLAPPDAGNLSCHQPEDQQCSQ